MTTRSYSDLSDSATTFDPEEQFDRNIDERMKGMSKEEAVAKASVSASDPLVEFFRWAMENGPFDGCGLDGADVQEKAAALGLIEPSKDRGDWWVYTDAAKRRSSAASTISPVLDSAIQKELDPPPASIMEEGK